MSKKEEESKGVLKEVVEGLLSALSPLARDHVASFSVTMTVKPREVERPGGGGACLCGAVCHSVLCPNECLDFGFCEPLCNPRTCREEACDGLGCPNYDCWVASCKDKTPIKTKGSNVKDLGHPEVQKKLRSKIK